MADQPNIAAIEQTLSHGIRWLQFGRDKSAPWCIHCNQFLSEDNPYDLESHAHLCPYAALASLVDEAKSLGTTRDLYYDLIMAVGNKHEGETRHMTALRYIIEAEQLGEEAQAATQSEQEGEGDR